MKIIFNVENFFVKVTLIIFAISLLLTACNKTPSDAEIRQKIQGVWTPDFNLDFTWKIEAGGRFTKLYKSGGTNGWTEDGNWSVTNKLLVFTMTNRDWPNYTVPDEFYRIVQVDNSEINFVNGDINGKARKNQ
jgi:hypothetical protein